MTAQRAAAAAAMRHAPRPRPANPARVMCRTESGRWRAAEGRNPGRPTERTLDPPLLCPLARFHRRQRAIRPIQEALGSEQLRVRICMGLEDLKDADLIFGSGAARHGWDSQLLDAPGKFFLRAPNQGLAMPKLARACFVADELAHQLAATYAHQATPLDILSQQAADRYPPPPLRCRPFVGHRPVTVHPKGVRPWLTR